MNVKTLVVCGICLFLLCTVVSAVENSIVEKDAAIIFGSAASTSRTEVITQSEMENTNGGITCRLIYDRATGRTFQICR